MSGAHVSGRRTTHKARILAWAKAGHVIHQDDWYFTAPDRAGAIKAVRSRICELEADGYGFHHTARPDGTIEYRLAYLPEREDLAPEHPPSEDAGGAQLAFETSDQLATHASRGLFYDVDEAA